MLTVRFPTRFSIQYNRVLQFEHRTPGWGHLYADKAQTDWVASVPPGCIVESDAPCAMSNPGLTVEAAVDILLAADLPEQSRRVQDKLADLKSLLARGWSRRSKGKDSSSERAR